MPGFLNFKLPRVGDQKLLLAVFTNQKGQSHELNLLELSEGQRVLIAMYAAAYGMLGPQALLCFDEPDNFVSLAEVQPWLQGLRDTLDQRGGQAMVISHHPEVIDYLALDSAWRFERPAGVVVARELDFGTEPGLKPSEIIARGG
jgi:ATPase subunit of ABC transporter with duplicated ATPase domains